VTCIVAIPGSNLGRDRTLQQTVTASTSFDTIIVNVLNSYLVGTGPLSPGVKRPPSSPEVKNAWSYTPLRNTCSRRGV
jgi:hypothetical protein